MYFVPERAAVPLTFICSNFLKNLRIVHKGSGGMTIAFPDVCKTPTPGGPVPIPYPNISKSSDTGKGTKKVKTGGEIALKLTGKNLENIISVDVCEGCNKNMNFKTSLEPVRKGEKNVTERKLTITYLGDDNQHFQINYRLDMISDPLFSSEYNLPEKEPIPYPVLGSEEYEINPNSFLITNVEFKG